MRRWERVCSGHRAWLMGHGLSPPGRPPGRVGDVPKRSGTWRRVLVLGTRSRSATARGDTCCHPFGGAEIVGVTAMERRGDTRTAAQRRRRIRRAPTRTSPAMTVPMTKSGYGDPAHATSARRRGRPCWRARRSPRRSCSPSCARRRRGGATRARDKRRSRRARRATSASSAAARDQLDQPSSSSSTSANSSSTGSGNTPARAWAILFLSAPAASACTAIH